MLPTIGSFPLNTRIKSFHATKFIGEAQKISENSYCILPDIAYAAGSFRQLVDFKAWKILS